MQLRMEAPVVCECSPTSIMTLRELALDKKDTPLSKT
jgi:hypothetical protein